MSRKRSIFKLDRIKGNEFLAACIQPNPKDNTRIVCTLCSDPQKEIDYFLYEGLLRHICSEKYTSNAVGANKDDSIG